MHKLNDIGFECWSVTIIESWYEKFEQLKAFQREHGHYRVPKTQVRQWVSTQRAQNRCLREGKKGYLITEEKIQKLNDIGFEWSVTTSSVDCHERDCHERFDQLKAFIKEHGHCRVPLDKDSATNTLSFWGSRQRTLYERLQQGKKRCVITEERTQKSNVIGFDWLLQQ
jgi:hypothetical protein